MIKKKIVEYLDFKGISKYKFYQETGIANGFLDKEGAIGSDKCEKICSHYQDLNIEWLINGVGSMIKNNINKSQLEFDLEEQKRIDEFGRFMEMLEAKNYIIDLQKQRIEQLEAEIVQLKRGDPVTKPNPPIKFTKSSKLIRQEK